MNERQWLASKDLQTMLQYSPNRIYQRKARLFLSACCREILSVFSVSLLKQAVENTEKYADGFMSADDLLRFYTIDSMSFHNVRVEAPVWRRTAALIAFRELMSSEILSIGKIVACAHQARIACNTTGNGGRGKKIQCDLLREIVGNPFKKTVINPAWLAWDNRTVLQVAQRIYDSREFDDMPILADALEDAGCTDPGILDHCRQSTVHVLGCWALDLLLGKQ